MNAAVALDPERLSAVCRQYHVQRLSVFGSVARGEPRLDSDIDVLVEFEPGAGTGMIAYGGLALALGQLVGRPVDLVSRPALHPKLRDSILASARLLYPA